MRRRSVHPNSFSKSVGNHVLTARSKHGDPRYATQLRGVEFRALGNCATPAAFLLGTSCARRSTAMRVHPRCTVVYMSLLDRVTCRNTIC